jgi:UDPglucose 6-dehydrogenase
VVATPTLPDGTYSNAQLEASLRPIGAALRSKPRFHTVVVSCTVMPGTLSTLVQPRLEELSGKRMGEGWGLAYNPEFIAMGDVIRNFRSPDFILVGESEPRVGDRLAGIYARVCSTDPPLARMNLVSAELAKIALNCYVTTKITFANMLAEVCERVPGADLDAITDSLGLDSRIGPKALRGGLGFGGPCFPRDNRAFATFAEARGASAQLARVVHATNERLCDRVAERIAGLVEPGATVAVLGLAYKPKTPLIDESQGMAIARRLVSNGCAVRVYDPLAMPTAEGLLGRTVTYADSVVRCLSGAKAAVVTTEAEEFASLTAEAFRRHLAPDAVVFDCWRLFQGQDFDGLRWVAPGVGLNGERSL